MKTPYKKIGIGLACLIAVWGCTRNMTDYRSLLNNQEITYPGKIVSPAILPGNLRLVLAWTPSPDPSVTKYVVYWNNSLDSTVLSANSHLPTDTVRCLISNLSEYSYTFFIYSYDGAGNRSVPTEIDNAQVYGPVYRSNLHNRHPDGSNISILNADGTVTLNFLAPTDTINITTKLRYVNAAGDSAAANLAPNTNSITLPTYKTGTKIVYNSSYIPKLGAIDTFVTLVPDTIPIYVMCDKSKFKGVYLPHDLVAGFGTSLPTMWDGNMQPRGYPDVFHSDGSGNPPLPGTVTIDMGQVYNGMGRVEETGRNCCHNPKEFEVWGIADTTGAISSLLPGDNGWKTDMTTRGWALLGDIVRTDDGTAPYDAMLISNPPPVRYLIVRFVSDVDNSGYINISQLTFWNKQ